MDDEAGTGESARTSWSAEAAATGEPRVDEALRSLGKLGDLPTSEHPAVFERVHGHLVEVLGELGSGTDQAGGRPGELAP